MKISRVYADDSGETHFADVVMALHDAGEIGMLSEPVAARSVLFRTTGARYDYDWHNTPCRQFVVMLDGHISIEVSDGERREFRGGDVFLLEDTHGRGHRTKELSGEVRRTLFIPLAGG